MEQSAKPLIETTEVRPSFDSSSAQSAAEVKETFDGGKTGPWKTCHRLHTDTSNVLASGSLQAPSQAQQTSPTVAHSGGTVEGRVGLINNHVGSRYEEKCGYSEDNKGDGLRELAPYRPDGVTLKPDCLCSVSKLLNENQSRLIVYQSKLTYISRDSNLI